MKSSHFQHQINPSTFRSFSHESVKDTVEKVGLPPKNAKASSTSSAGQERRLFTTEDVPSCLCVLLL